MALTQQYVAVIHLWLNDNGLLIPIWNTDDENRVI